MGTIKSRIIFLNPPENISLEPLKLILISIAEEHGFKTDQIVYHFVSREKIKVINISHLQHDYHTDVITFSYGRSFKIRSDIYICDEVIIENAKDRNINIIEERYRVVFHGLLHLLGFNDKTNGEAMIMRSKEEECLNRLTNGQQ